MEGGRGGAPRRCGPAATSSGVVAAQQPQRRDGLAAPPPQPRTRTQGNGAAALEGGAPGLWRGMGDRSRSEPGERQCLGKVGLAAAPWQRGARRGRRAARPWIGHRLR
jgi:hypothetical protein